MVHPSSYPMDADTSYKKTKFASPSLLVEIFETIIILFRLSLTYYKVSIVTRPWAGWPEFNSRQG